MRTCGNYNCKNYGKSWDLKHHSICPYCPSEIGVIKLTREEIMRISHLNDSSELARKYFKDLGLDYSKIKLSDLYKLREFMLDETYPLLADKTYSMIKELTMDKKIKSKFKKELLIEAELYTNGSYFHQREAVTFNENGFIGFCGWASGCNRIPYINGFLKWCDYVSSQIKFKDTSCIPSNEIL